MTVAFWCLLVVLAAPYILSGAARSEGKRGEHAQDPRAYSESLTGWHRRAHLAHLNAFEAIPALVAAVMVAEFSHAPRVYIDAIAVAFVVFRALHAIFYLADRPKLRGRAFRLSLICIIGLFVVAAVFGRASAT